VNCYEPLRVSVAAFWNINKCSEYEVYGIMIYR